MMPFGHSAVFMRCCQLHYEFVKREIINYFIDTKNPKPQTKNQTRQTILSILCRNILIICSSVILVEWWQASSFVQL